MQPTLVVTLQATNISFSQGMFEDEFPFPKVGYVSSLVVTLPETNINALKTDGWKRIVSFLV